MMIAPIAAAATATTTEGATPSGGEGFEETMAAILGLAMQAQGQLPAQPTPTTQPTELDSAAPTAMPVVPAGGMPSRAPSELPEPVSGVIPPQTPVDTPAAPSTDPGVSTTPPLPHPGVRFPERRVAQQAVASTTTQSTSTEPASTTAVPTAAPVDPLVPPTDSQPDAPVAATQAVTQAVALTAGAATAAAAPASTTQAPAPSRDASGTPADRSRPIGPVESPAPRAAELRSGPVEQSPEHLTQPPASEEAVIEEPPTMRNERRSVEAPSTPVGPRQETSAMSVEAGPTHISGHVLDGDSPVPSTMIQRVEEVVRRLENAPPPRSITLSIDDQGVTKVTVSVLSDGVRLTVPEGSQTPTGLVGQLERALESRGFDLSQDGRRQRPQDDEVETPWTPTAAPQRRPEPDAAVRL